MHQGHAESLRSDHVTRVRGQWARRPRSAHRITGCFGSNEHTRGCRTATAATSPVNAPTVRAHGEALSNVAYRPGRAKGRSTCPTRRVKTEALQRPIRIRCPDHVRRNPEDAMAVSPDRSEHRRTARVSSVARDPDVVDGPCGLFACGLAGSPRGRWPGGVGSGRREQARVSGLGATGRAKRWHFRRRHRGRRSLWPIRRGCRPRSSHSPRQTCGKAT